MSATVEMLRPIFFDVAPDIALNEIIRGVRK